MAPCSRSRSRAEEGCPAAAASPRRGPKAELGRARSARAAAAPPRRGRLAASIAREEGGGGAAAVLACAPCTPAPPRPPALRRAAGEGERGGGRTRGRRPVREEVGPRRRGRWTVPPSVPSCGAKARRLTPRRPCGCLPGERRCNFASSLSSKASCLARLPSLLERIPRVNSAERRGKNTFALSVEVSLRSSMSTSPTIIKLI